MNYKDKFDYLPIEEVKGQGSFVKAVCFKPKKAPIICIILGILLMIPNNMYVRLLGAFFILMALAVLKLVKTEKQRVRSLFRLMRSKAGTSIIAAATMSWRSN